MNKTESAIRTMTTNNSHITAKETLSPYLNTMDYPFVQSMQHSRKVKSKYHPKRNSYYAVVCLMQSKHATTASQPLQMELRGIEPRTFCSFMHFPGQQAISNNISKIYKLFRNIRASHPSRTGSSLYDSILWIDKSRFIYGSTISVM